MEPTSDSVYDSCIKIVENYVTNENLPFDYDVGYILDRAEVHTVVAIGMHDYKTISEIAEFFGVPTKNSTLMIEKLLKKELILITNSSENNNQLNFSLTKQGEKVFSGHMQYHKKLYKEHFKYLSGFSNYDYQILLHIMHQIQTLLRQELFKLNN